MGAGGGPHPSSKRELQGAAGTPLAPSFVRPQSLRAVALSRAPGAATRAGRAQASRPQVRSPRAGGGKTALVAVARA